MKRISKKHAVSLLVLVLLACLVSVASADTQVGGLPLTTVQTGTVTGDLFIAGSPPSADFLEVVDRTFTLPDAAVAESGRIKWARLYVSSYCGNMQEARYITYTTKVDWNNDGAWDTTWTETDPGQIFYYLQGGDYGGGGNDNSEFPGHGTGEPYLMLNDHTTRVTSDYLSWYDVKDLIQVGQPTIKVNVNATGSYDGRIKVVTLVVAYDDPASTTETLYWVNEGHDSCTRYTEDNEGIVAVGTTSFTTGVISGITSATLIVDYMASLNGQYGFPTADNNFDASGGFPGTGDFTNIALDRVADSQGLYSGRDSWIVTSLVEGKNSVTLGYSRYLPGTGTAAFYKIPLAFLVVKRPLSVPAPVADFSADDTTPDVGQTVTFTDASTNTPTSWQWTIEGTENTDYEYVDSTSSTSQNPHVKFMNPGVYDVTLVATNAGGSGTTTKTDYITVTAPSVPTIEVTLNPESVSLTNMVPGQDATGSATVNVVASNGNSWSVSASDGKTTNKGYMVNGSTVLANPIQLGKDGSNYQALTSDYTNFMSGTTMGSFSATASLKQPVASGDAAGDYAITITFTGSIS